LLLRVHHPTTSPILAPSTIHHPATQAANIHPRGT
jgi:hypothetical protein